MWGTRKPNTIITKPGWEWDTKSKNNRIFQGTKTDTSIRAQVIEITVYQGRVQQAKNKTSMTNI